MFTDIGSPGTLPRSRILGARRGASPRCRSSKTGLTHAAGELPQNHLPGASRQAGAERHQNVPPRTGTLGGVQQVGAGAAPHNVLHYFEQPGQRRGNRACAHTSEQYRQPEAGCAGAAKRGRYSVVEGMRSCQYDRRFGVAFTRGQASRRVYDCALNRRRVHFELAVQARTKVFRIDFGELGAKKEQLG